MLYDDRQAAAYDARYPERFAEADTIAAFLAELERPPGPVLELGIGTGRVALPLVARGVDVHGIDASPAMVAKLRAKPGGERIPVVEGDFADVGRLVEGPYAMAFVAFNTIFELRSQDEQARCVAGVAGRLLDGGLFVVEAIAPVIAEPGHAVTVAHGPADAVRFQVTHHDPTAQVVTGQTVTVSEGGVDLWPWSIRYATVAELDMMVAAAGLALRERYGGWSHEPFTDDSVRHVSVYRRRGGG